MYYVNLEKYFNHKIVSLQYKTDKIVSRFDLNEFPKFKRTLNVEDINFLMPLVSDNKFDNIACCGQSIRLLPDKFKSIYFLGFSESQKEIGEFRLHYCNGTEIIRNVSVDACKETSKESDTIAVISGKNLQGNHVNIFIYKIDFPEFESLADSLVLPMNDQIHLIALSLSA